MAVSEKLRKKLEKRRVNLAAGNGLGYLTFKEGTTCIRILSLGVDEDFGIEATRIYASQALGGIISCITIGVESPLIEKYKELKNSEDEDDQEAAEALRPRKTYFVLCLECDEKGKTVTGTEPKLALIAKGVYEELLDLMLDEDNGDFTDPKEGYVVKIKRTGKGQYDTEYKVLAGKPVKVDKKWLSHQDPEKYLKAIVATPEEEEDYINEYFGTEAPTKKKSTKKGKKASSDLDEAPTKKKKKKVTEEKPAKKKKVKK